MPIYIERQSHLVQSKELEKQWSDDWIKQKSKGICEHCHLRPSVCIHEIVPKSLSPASWWWDENRIALCNECHTMVHTKGTKKMATQLYSDIDYRCNF